MIFYRYLLKLVDLLTVDKGYDPNTVTTILSYSQNVTYQNRHITGCVHVSNMMDTTFGTGSVYFSGAPEIKVDLSRSNINVKTANIVRCLFIALEWWFFLTPFCYCEDIKVEELQISEYAFNRQSTLYRSNYPWKIYFLTLCFW